MRHPVRQALVAPLMLLAALILAVPAFGQGAEGELDGSVELIYRAVGQGGSDKKDAGKNKADQNVLAPLHHWAGSGVASEECARSSSTVSSMARSTGMRTMPSAWLTHS